MSPSSRHLTSGKLPGPTSAEIMGFPAACSEGAGNPYVTTDSCFPAVVLLQVPTSAKAAPDG